MTPYKVTASAKSTFLALPSIVAVPVNNAVNPRVFCGIKCLRLRSTRFDFLSCNGFLHENDNCYLGYADPDWIYEQKQNPGTDAKLYFDINFP